MNEAAVELCRANPKLVAKKGDLKAKCGEMVNADGFAYKKGRSRAGHSSQGVYTKAKAREDSLKELETSIKEKQQKADQLNLKKKKFHDSGDV